MARGRARLTTLALSGVFHLLALGWLLAQHDPFPVGAASPPMIVTLVTPRRPPPAPRRAPAPAPPSPGPVRPETPTVPPPVAPGVVLPEAGRPDRAAADGVRQALRGLVGCDHATLVGMTAQERERCQDRLAARGRGPPAPRLNLDIRGEFAADPEPYLTRKPKNGCKLRAAGATGPLGKDGGVAGVNCVWSF